MVLRSARLTPLTLVVGALAVALVACVQPNPTGVLPDAAATDTPGARDALPDSAPETAPEARPEAAAEVPSPTDAADTTPAPDVMPTECMPRERGCADSRTPRTCNDQGRWTTAAACSVDTACSAGVCLCAGDCAEPAIAETGTSGLLEDLVGGDRFLFLAVNGPQASIRRFDLVSKMETVVKSAGLDVARFSLDSDGMGNLLWCSDVVSGTTRTGQLMYGNVQLDTGACTHVRRRDNFVYFKGDVLYRRTLDPSASRETVSREAMTTFELAGDDLYFIGAVGDEAFLKKHPLGDATKVETLLRRANATFLQLMPDTSHVYVLSEGQILRVGRAAGAQAETFWQEAGPEAWSMAQTGSHLYWSTATSGATDCIEAQVLRRAKAGGPVATLARMPGHCAGHVARVGDHLYAAVWSGPPGAARAKILRIRP